MRTWVLAAAVLAALVAAGCGDHGQSGAPRAFCDAASRYETELQREQTNGTRDPAQQLELVPQGTTELDFEIHCSAGTYIRSLAHEIGKLLGCGAHLTRLRRLASGEFQLDQAFSLDSFRKLGESELLRHLIPMNNALRSLPEVKVDAEMQGQIAHGRNFAAMVPLSSLSAQPLFRMQSPGGELLGLAELITGQATHKDSDASSSLFHPKVVL